ncbi:MAG: hypothetical protein ACJ76S_07070 [Solirubrobacteraceae bacterium]
MEWIDSAAGMPYRSERVVLETARYRITGMVTLPRDGYRSRFSDFLNSSERDFLSLTDVTLQALDHEGRPGEPTTRDYLAVSRQHIVLATTANGADDDE